MSTLERIKTRTDYLSVAASGRRWVTPAFILQIKDAGDSDSDPRVGFTVTKKVGNAVVRNRVRRRLKEAAREIFPVKASEGSNYVLIGRYACIDIAFKRIKSDMKWALQKLEAKADLKSAPATDRAK